MHLVNLCLAAAAWVGHSALWTVGLNVLYGLPYHRAFLRLCRLAVGVIVFSFPLMIGILWQLEIALPQAARLYLAACVGMCLVVIPVVTLQRLLQPKPPQLLQRQREVIDFAQRLGRKPAGEGKCRRIALLPGNQVFQVEFVEVTLRLPRIPDAWDGLTILQLTDWHFTGTPERAWYEAVIDRAMAPGVPDVVALTGDYADTESSHEWMGPLFSRLKWNEAGLAIVGNHDYWYEPDRVRGELARAGLTVLGNRWQEVRVRGEPLIAVGHEGPWFRPGPDLRDCPAGFKLCLSHTPDNIAWARAAGIDLMLCGHNHGGQIRLPVFGSLFVPSVYSREFDGGLFDEPPTLMYVGRGLGGREPLRYNCRPEVTRFTLRKG